MTDSAQSNHAAHSSHHHIHGDSHFKLQSGQPQTHQHRHGNWLPIFPGGRKPEFRYQDRIPSFFNMNFLTTALKSLEPRIDDDFIDRLNYYYTSSAMIIFAILVSAKQYVGHPIECWVPAQFTKGMEQNTYWVPFGELIPTKITDREKRQIGYYQWVPFLLAVQALMFYIPATVWRLLNTQSGINLHGVLQMACDEHNIEPENRGRTVHILSRHIDDSLRHQRDFGTKSKPVYLWTWVKLGKLYGAYVALLYCLMKVLYLLNVFGQFFLLNRFLETDDYPFFGAHVLWDMLHGREWINSGKFPRVTLCDFEIRNLGNLHRHTIQCVLVINMFTEKVFVFLWLWFLFLSIATLANLFFWVLTLGFPTFRTNFILKHLELSDSPPDPDRDSTALRRFVCNFLRPDGVFILRMLSIHAGNIITQELTENLWHRYRKSVAPPLTMYPLQAELGLKVPLVFDRIDKSIGTDEFVPIPFLEIGGDGLIDPTEKSSKDSDSLVGNSKPVKSGILAKHGILPLPKIRPERVTFSPNTKKHDNNNTKDVGFMENPPPPPNPSDIVSV